MPCTLIDKNTIVCQRGVQARAKCVSCHRPHTKLCDFEIAPGKTCDAPLCGSCATSGGTNVDYCREHALRAPAVQLALIELGAVRERLPIGHTLVGACRECGGHLVLRFSRRFRALFYGCSRYPGCRFVRGADHDGHPLEQTQRVAHRSGARV